MNLGQIFTNKNIADYMATLFSLPTDAKILDPCFGKGVFINTMQEKGFTKITGVEIDPALFVQAKSTLSSVTLINEDFLSFNNEELFDGIIMNPPYIRQEEIDNLKSLLQTTSNGNAPQILLTGLRGVGKTVFLKKIKKELDNDYLVVYINFSKAECYQKRNMSVMGLMEFFFKEFLIEAKNKNLNTLDKRIEKYFKVNDFKIKDFIQLDKFPMPIFDSETNVEKLMDFVLTLPEKIHESNSDKIKGVLIFIDEFQIIKELDDYKESFLWKLRSYIQNQNYVSYVFSGSMSMQDELISEIASQRGAFGGRMLTINISPFSKETVKSYLTQEVPNLKFSDEGFDRFFKCTSGIPAYVNIFATLLPKDIELDENLVKSEFEDKIEEGLLNIHSHILMLSTQHQLR